MSGYESGPLPGSFPERRQDPPEEPRGVRDRRHVCGCGRGCVSWPDHFARIEAEKPRRQP